MKLSIPELKRRVHAAEAEMTDARRNYLEACGWKHTSATPDSRWLWVKTIDGVAWGVTVDTALVIQEAIDRV